MGAGTVAVADHSLELEVLLAGVVGLALALVARSDLVKAAVDIELNLDLIAVEQKAVDYIEELARVVAVFAVYRLAGQLRPQFVEQLV